MEKPDRAQSERAAKGLAVSVMFHLLVLVLLGGMAMSIERDRPPEPVYDVALIGSPGSSSPAPAAAPAAPPAVQEAPPEPTPPPEPDDIVEEKEPIREPTPEPVPQPQPQPKPETVQPPAPVPAASPVSPAAGTGGGGSGEGTGDKDQPGAGDGGGNGDSLAPASDAIEAPTVPPHILSSRAPEYPRAARNRGIEGTTVVRFLLDKEGGVDDVEIVESSGSDALDRAAMEAAADFTFSPGLDSHGRPVRCYAYQSFRFRLE